MRIASEEDRRMNGFFGATGARLIAPPDSAARSLIVEDHVVDRYRIEVLACRFIHVRPLPLADSRIGEVEGRPAAAEPGRMMSELVVLVAGVDNPICVSHLGEERNAVVMLICAGHCALAVLRTENRRIALTAARARSIPVDVHRHIEAADDWRRGAVGIGTEAAGVAGRRKHAVRAPDEALFVTEPFELHGGLLAAVLERREFAEGRPTARRLLGRQWSGGAGRSSEDRHRAPSRSNGKKQDI